MKILAIDTASFPASAAIVEDGVVLGEYVIRNQRKHSQNIMMMVERLFDDLSMDISEIDKFAVTVGPGSFTGLRIGISSVRAFAQAVNKPVSGISTLEALAYNFCGRDNIIVPMLDARRDEVFTAAYRFNYGKCEEILAPCVMTITEICGLFTDCKVIFTGDGAIKHHDEILKKTDNAEFASANLSEIRAAAAAVCAIEKPNMQYNDIVPVYLRKSQAERELELKKSKENLEL